MVRWPHRSAKGITLPSTGSEISTRARGCEARLRPLLFVLVFSMLAGRGGESVSLDSGSSRLLSSHMNVHGMYGLGQREDTNSWDAGPGRGLEKGMVNVDGFEIPKHATGWDRVRAMSDSSWKRASKTVGPTPRHPQPYTLQPACPTVYPGHPANTLGRTTRMLASADDLVCRCVRC